MALHFDGTELKEAVTDVAGRSAYRVEPVDGTVRETALPTRLLG